MYRFTVLKAQKVYRFTVHGVYRFTVENLLRRQGFPQQAGSSIRGGKKSFRLERHGGAARRKHHNPSCGVLELEARVDQMDFPEGLHGFPAEVLDVVVVGSELSLETAPGDELWFALTGNRERLVRGPGVEIKGQGRVLEHTKGAKVHRHRRGRKGRVKTSRPAQPSYPPTRTSPDVPSGRLRGDLGIYSPFSDAGAVSGTLYLAKRRLSASARRSWTFPPLLA